VSQHEAAGSTAVFSRRRRARRRTLLRRLLAAVAGLGVALGGLWLVFFSSVLAVTGSDVRGVEVLDEDAVRTAARVPEGVPLATVDLAAIRARVEDLAPVRSAQVSRSWPDRVRIDVTERDALAFVEWNGGWRGFDEAGVLFRDYATKPTDLPQVRVSATTPVEALAESAAIVGSLPPNLLGRVEHVEVRSIDDITLMLGNGASVRWGSADQSPDKAAVLEVLLEQPARAYDVTAPGRPTISR
jgi:cell division protein FtsQ